MDSNVGTIAYRGPVVQGLAFQFLALVLSVLVMDYGDTLRITGVALVGYWSAALMLFLRRPNQPTKLDLAFLGWAFLPLVIACQVVTRLVWTWRGLPH